MWLFVGGIAIAMGVDAVILTETEEFKFHEDVQKAELSTNGHFKHVPRGNGDFQIDEYVLPDGTAGFTITKWRTVDGVEQKKVVDYGSLNRDIDWPTWTSSTST